MAKGPFYEVGLYVGEIREHGITKAQTGTMQLVWKVKILGFPTEDGSVENFRQQYERTIYMALTERTVSFVSESLQSIGFEGERVSQLDPKSPQAVSMVGKRVHLWCKHEPGQDGEPRERWMFSKGPQTLELTQLSSKEVRELDALFGKGNRSAKPPAPVQNVHNEEITDEDIPF